MITFLPYPSFIESADCLDFWKTSKMNRLNNQVNEVIIIAQSLLGERPATTHPAFEMWKDFELALIDCGWTCLYTFERKNGSVDNRRRETMVRLQALAMEKAGNPEFYVNAATGNIIDKLPWWLGDERLHSNHRSILLGKNYKWYSQFGWPEQPAVKNGSSKWGYFWPTKMKEE